MSDKDQPMTAPAGAPAKEQAADVIRQLDEQRAAPGRLGMLTIDGSFEDKWWPLYGETLVRGLLRELDAARAEGIHPGDRIAVSVALIREIAALPSQHSEACEVVKITPEPDGTKLLWLQRLDARRDRT